MASLAFSLDSPRAAHSPEDLFGAMIGTRKEQSELLRSSYRSLARVTHPDLSPAPDAEASFIKLERLYEEAQTALRSGRYGRARFHAPLLLQGRESYRVLDSWEGELANLYLAQCAAGEAFLKQARNAAGDKALAREAALLQKLSSDKAVESRLKPYVPLLLESFEQKGASGERRVNALRNYQGFYTLEEVRQAYPQGLPWRDAAWIMLRLLVAIGYAHANGVVHAAVLPEHVLVAPDEHGLVLLDWTHATEPGVKGREQMLDWPREAAGAAASEWYPLEMVTSAVPPSPSSDIYTAARTIEYLLGADPKRDWQLPDQVPVQLRGFLSGCAVSQAARRPDDAWELRAELEGLFGERKFRPLKMPGLKPETSESTTPTNNSTTERSN